VLVAGLVSTSAAAQGTGAPPAQPAAAPPPPAKTWTLTGGVDFPTAYVFRGILQEDKGFIAEPWVDLAVALAGGVTVNVGNWDSLHSGPTGKFYESDYYGAVTFTAGKWVKPGLLFTSYTSPNDRFATVNELAGVLAINDSARKVPFSPKIVLGFELTDGQADGGANKGVYLELGVKPTVKVSPKLSIAVPVKLGLSAKDYYEGPTGSNTFGYFDIGVQASIPVASGKGGSLELHGGVDLLTFGDNLKVLNHDDKVKAVGLIGFSFTY
jgi:hypothetical protein